MHVKTLVIIILTAALFSILLIFLFSPEQKESIVVLHAGSLSIPFSKLEERFEEKYGIGVHREAAGSVATIKKVTELGKKADVVASADYTLIEDMMINESHKYADYCIQFAKNSMVIAYTHKSLYNEEINGSNWYEILARKDVKFGFSNPNKDPCGYRTMAVIQLAEIYYGNESIFDELIEKNTPIKSKEDNGSHVISIPESTALSSNSKIMIRDMEIDLMGALETGEIDYLFIYRSVASQHAPSGVKFIELPPEIDLSATEYKDVYGKVSITFYDGKTMRGKPIVYGVTIPSNAEHVDMAIKFLQMLLGEEGQQILRQEGQIPIVPAICDNKDLLPPALKPYVK